MAYSDFTIESIKTQFGIRLNESGKNFCEVAGVSISSLLRETLMEQLPLAQAISTEKARSELVISPVLVEARRQVDRKVSLFSGVDFTVDSARGLRGTCDFLMSNSTEQLIVEAPVIAIVEAKNENFAAGFGQCIAEMVAAQLFNERRDQSVDAIYGVVTTGSLWKFMRLQGDEVVIDLEEYHISQVDRIVGILVAMLRGM